MNPLHFIGLIFLFFLTISLNSVKCEAIKKCCPIGWQLKIEVNFILTCETAFQDDQSTFDAYNVEYVNHPSIPQCQYSVRKLFKNNEKFTQINGCVDRSANGDLFAVSCDSGEPVIEVHELNKCCASGNFYDYTERRCTTNFESNLNLQRFFNNEVILFKTQVPDCGPNEVFVEYISTKHEIKFINHDLYIFDEMLEPKSFCVEGLLKISPNEMIADHLIVRSCRPKTICERIPCIQRCCKTDQVITRTECLAHPHKADIVPIFNGQELPIITDDQQTNHNFVREFGVLHSLKCKVGRSPLDPSDQHQFHKNGSITVGSSKYERHEFCIENALFSPDYIEMTIFLCLGYENQNLEKFEYYPFGLIISCVFLAITLIVYLAIPNLLNIHGKTLVCYVVSFLAAYIILAYLQIEVHGDVLGPMCYQIAPVLLFCLIAQFCWQTMMCVDIWQTISSLQAMHTSRHNKRDKRKFWYYSVYAWGFPFAWTMFTVFASKYEPFSDGWNPTYGVASCFFSSSVQKKEHFLYFLLPSGLHVLINCALFAMTAIYCTRVKGEIHRMQADIDETSTTAKRKKFIASKAIFIMNLKLATVMGISWILEIISTFVANSFFEIIQDLYNIFLGIAIFVIFVFKRKVYQEFKSRIGIKTRARDTGTPRTTSSTNPMAARSMNDLSLVGASVANVNRAHGK